MKLFIFLISFSVSLATQDQCGISKVNSGGPTGLIFNGELAEDSQWPWAAAVYLKYGEKRNFLCSGTLISGQSVLTVAHCIQDKGRSRFDTDIMSVTFGTADSSNNNGVIRSAIETVMHPEWNIDSRTPYDADLAIIKLDRLVEFSDKIRPICLPKPHEKVFEVTGFVAGYGVSNSDVLDGKLRYLKIPTVTQEICLWHPSGLSIIASNRTFCGGDLTRSACKGDSGAGFVVRTPTSSFKIIGIVSASLLRPDENCRPDNYVVFTNVPMFVDWILKEIDREKEISDEIWNHHNISNANVPPNSVYIDEGSARTYVARRKMDGNLVIGKFIPLWNSIYVPYFRGELQFWDKIEILATHSKYQFIPFNGTFPRNAVQGGYEGTVKLFVGRKTIDGKHLLGKIADTLKIIYVPYFAKEYEFDDDFDILILSDIGWTSFNSSIDQIPSDAISINEDNLKTYVARRKIDKNVVVGKFSPILNSLSVTYNGTEFKFRDGIEIMTTNKPHKWIPFTGTFPSNAVQGGYEGAAKLYVGRVRHPTKYIIGKVVDTTRTISFGFFDKEFKYKNSFEILVLEN